MDISKPIFYLGTPYTHPEPKIKSFRYRAVTKMTHDLLMQGRLVYSPITHNAPIDHLGFCGNYKTWMEFDHGMLSRCNGLIVFKLPGWEESKGLQAEIELATKLNLPIEEIIPSPEFLESILDENNTESTFSKLLKNINQMNAERDWEQFNAPKNLAMSLQAEASEVAEHFTWLTLEQSSNLSTEIKRMVSEELWDVFINLIHLSDKLGIDLFEATFQKIEKIKQKYPTEKYKGISQRYSTVT